MLEIFSTETRTEDDQVIRSFFGKSQIQGVDAVKPMRFLSGGQKSRVSFAVLVYQKPHLLIIDEGSNHMSMDAVDGLIASIQQFKGGYWWSVTINTLSVRPVMNYGSSITESPHFLREPLMNTSLYGQKDKKRVEECVKKMANLNH